MDYSCITFVEVSWISYLWWLIDLEFHPVEFRILERNDELSQFLVIGKREETHAVWLGHSLFHDQKLRHCEGDVTRRMYMERYQNVVQYFGIPTNFQKYPINTAIHCLCYRHKQAQIAQKHAPFNLCFANTNQLPAAI
jgi:hypothetical protein